MICSLIVGKLDINLLSIFIDLLARQALMQPELRGVVVVVCISGHSGEDPISITSFQEADVGTLPPCPLLLLVCTDIPRALKFCIRPV